MKNKNIKTTIKIPMEIKAGDNTHHQFQSITLQSFKTMNTMVNKPTKPIPPLDELLELLIFLN